MVEDVQPIDDNTVEIIAPVTPWKHVRTIGEDIVTTELILSDGHYIRPIDLGAMLATGLLKNLITGGDLRQNQAGNLFQGLTYPYAP